MKMTIFRVSLLLTITDYGVLYDYLWGIKKIASHLVTVKCAAIK